MMTDKIFENFKTFISNRKFLYLLIGIVVLQGLWYALNYRPVILDEGRHMGFIQLYTETANPFITNQDSKWDALGEVTREPSYLYYYLMSWPLRLISVFTENYRTQLFVIRLISIALFAAAIVIFDKFFKRLKLSTVISRVVLLFLIITPSVAVLPGAVSYDNLSLLMSALLLLVATIMLDKKHIDYKLLSILIIISGFGTVVKYTFLAIAFPVLLYLIFDIFRNKKYIKPELSLNKMTLILGILCLLSIGVFIERPIKNLIVYGKIVPSCAEFIGEERCSKNYVQERDFAAIKSRDSKEIKSIYEYTVVDWVPNMIRSQVRLNPWDAPVPAMFVLYSLAVYGGAVILLLYFRDLLKSKFIVFISITFIVYTLLLFLSNYQSYKTLGEVIATSSRYLLPVQPLFMLFVALAIRKLFGNRRELLLICLLVILAVFVTGGSITTYAKTADPGTRWSD